MTTAFWLTSTATFAQMDKWILNPKEIDFAAGTANSVTTGASIPYKVENAVYSEGVLQFYANDGIVYDPAGNYIGQFAGGPAAMLKEIAVAPGPGSCNNWCLLWLETSPLATLTFHYQEVKNDNGVVEFGTGGTAGDGSLFGNEGGLAVSHIVTGTEADRDIYLVTFDAVRKFRLTSLGVTLLQTFPIPGGSGFVAEADLSPDGKFLAWNKWNRAFVMNVNSPSEIYSVSLGSTFSNIYGLEFSADGQHLYLSHSELGLRRWNNFLASTEVEALSESNTYNNTQLELAKDGRIYAVRNDGVLGIIQGLTVGQSPLGISVFSNQPPPVGGYYYGLPDQVDGEDYSNFYGVPLVTVNTMSVNSSTLTDDCGSPLSVYNCNSILFNATYDGGTPSSYMLDIQAVNSTCALVTGTGFLNYSSGLIPGAPPANLDLTTLTDPAGLNLGNSTGKFVVTLTVRNGCRIERSAFGYLLVNGPPTPASVSLTINGWVTPGVPQPPAANPPGVSVGIYSASFNINNSTGYITYYTIGIDQVDCTTGAFIREIYPATTTSAPGSLSSLTAIALNQLDVPAIPTLSWPGGQGFFANNSMGNCYLLHVTVGNECSSSAASSFLKFDCTCFNGGSGEDRSAGEEESNTEVQPEMLFTAYPNPVISLLTFQYAMQTEGQLKVLIADRTGRVVSAESSAQNAGKHEFEYDARALSPGLYVYRFITPSGEYTGKFLKVER